MNLIVLEKNQIDEVVANLFVETINNKPNCVLGLATGSSPVGIYKNLVKAYQENKVSFKDVKTFNLDEYIGLEETHHQSYRYFMNDNLFNHIDIDKNNTHVPNGINYEYDVENYDKEIENNGGIDLQILGIGSNCHSLPVFVTLTSHSNNSGILIAANFFNALRSLSRSYTR